MRRFFARFSNRSVGVLAPTERRCQELLIKYEDATPEDLEDLGPREELSPGEAQRRLEEAYRKAYPTSNVSE